MIPKRIFYMWRGSTKPIDVQMCLLSWKKNLPNYEIIEINESNSEYIHWNELISKNNFLEFSIRNKMWAYTADYIRCYVLNKFGGIWLDTDVTVLKDFDQMLNNSLFFGRENDTEDHVETAVIGAEKEHLILQDILKFYDNEIWQSSLYTGPRITTEILKRHGINLSQKGTISWQNITIYSPEYFYPLPLNSPFFDECISQKTISIHWWKASWGHSEITHWLKNKHLIQKDKALQMTLTPFITLYLFSFLRIGTYYPKNHTIRLFKFLIFNIKTEKNKKKLMLWQFLPIIKWR